MENYKFSVGDKVVFKNNLPSDLKHYEGMKVTISGLSWNYGPVYTLSGFDGYEYFSEKNFKKLI